MSDSVNHGYTVVRDAEAFVPRLTGDKLLKAQERLAFGLVKRNSLLPWIKPRTGIGPEHFPTDLQSLIVAAKTKTHEQIMAIAGSQREGKIAQAYRRGIELSHGEALMLAKQIVLSSIHHRANGGDTQSNQNPITAEVGPQSGRPVSNQLVRHIDDATPGSRAPKKTIANTITPSLRAQHKTKSSNPKHKEHLKEGLYVLPAAEVTPKRVDAVWSDKKGGVRLARGEHTMIAGEPGLGKSQTAIAMAAAVSTGGDWPCGEGHAPLGDVIFLAAEDSIEHTRASR
jgi:hypothetical protein